MLKERLLPPCSYQGGKQRIAQNIVDVIFKQSNIDDHTQFYDLCCGSGAITLELINRGICTNNITMVDVSMWGLFYQSVANNTFDLDIFKDEINKLPNIEYIQDYLKKINTEPIDEDLAVYHFLLQQAGAFGSKAVDIKNGRWIVSSFRNYWKPTETSNRRSPVNPMMPMPDTLYSRVENIVGYMGGNVNAIYNDILSIEWGFNNNSIVYIDPPYKNTLKYHSDFDYIKFVEKYQSKVDIYISEGYKMEDSDDSFFISSGRKKGNISGNSKKKPSEEWVNVYRRY